MLEPFDDSFYENVDVIQLNAVSTETDTEGGIDLTPGDAGDEIACNVQFMSQLNTGRLEEGPATSGLDRGTILIRRSDLGDATIEAESSILWTSHAGAEKDPPVSLFVESVQDPSGTGADVYRVMFSVRR